jgi:hypothetical protein
MIDKSIAVNKMPFISVFISGIIVYKYTILKMPNEKNRPG